ncbi:hypothetical protein ACFWGI_35690 [Streptomyces niveus]|uniref:hypothetical protein n=1 Tax=Streptomyces niveus TaxID=193462 RepID=UPI00366554B8
MPLAGFPDAADTFAHGLELAYSRMLFDASVPEVIDGRTGFSRAYESPSPKPAHVDAAALPHNSHGHPTMSDTPRRIVHTMAVRAVRTLLNFLERRTPACCQPPASRGIFSAPAHLDGSVEGFECPGTATEVITADGRPTQGPA